MAAEGLRTIGKLAGATHGGRVLGVLQIPQKAHRDTRRIHAAVGIAGVTVGKMAKDRPRLQG